MTIRMVRREELNTASGLARYVFDNCLKYRMEFSQTIAFVEEYIAEENLKQLYDACELILWGVYEGEQMVAVSALQSDGLISMLYVLPQCQNRGYGSKLLMTMREYAKTRLGASRVSLNANPAWTSRFFAKKGFVNFDENQSSYTPFVSMYALSKDINTVSKRPIPKWVIVLAVISCILFATIAGCLFMVSYLF